MILTNPANVNDLSDSKIAYLSCDNDAYKGNVNAAQTFNIALARSPPPVAIVLYSLNAHRCTLAPLNNRNTYIYSMRDIASAADIVKVLQNTMDSHNSTIKAHDNGGGGGGGILGKSPTTAVAMIILYSITGIITALFLIIIIIGAIRAHRHPERYGPRNIHGRPRQSRAKGIARAMLETIPIVKFGDNDAPKAAEPAVNPQRDIEMAPPQSLPETSSQAQPHPSSTASAVPKGQPEANHDAVTTETATNDPTNTPSTDDPVANADNGLACSVCTDDFTKGQDVRVLPCNHKFHPECIDPWLLNVSGTCPLCRVDLRPTASNEDGHAEDATATSTVAPQSRRNSEALTSFNPAQNQSRRNSRARPLHYLHHYLNRGRMEQATPQERLEALRRLRLVNRSDVDHATVQQDGSTIAESSAAGGNRSRLSARLSRAFGGDRSRPVSGVPSIPSTTPAVPEAREGMEGAAADTTATAAVGASGSAGEARR